MTRRKLWPNGSIPACAGDRLGLDDLDAFHIFHGEHFGRGEVAVHLRHLHFGEDRHVVGQAAGVEGLVAIVQFFDQIFGEFLEDAEDVVVVHPGEAVAERREQLAQNFQVSLDLGHDVGALDFDHDRLAVGSVALWTWAVEAAAKGSVPNSVKSWAMGFFSSASMIWMASSVGKGGTLLWSLASSPAIPGATLRRGWRPSGQISRRSAPASGA